MENSQMSELTIRFQEAVDSFVDKVKSDPNVVAVILCGSLAYDQVWEKSDIDMTLVVRDQVLKNTSYCIVEDDITINVGLVVRSEFKRHLDGIHGGSFMHSYYSKGKVIYSTDDSLEEYFEDFKSMGSDDMAMSVFYLACELLGYHEKCIKWLTVKQDPLYAQYYLLKAAEVIARIEVCLHGESPSREAVIRACTLNPELMKPFYQDAMSHFYSPEEITKALETIDKFLELITDIIKKPVLSYMNDQEIKTFTMIGKHFHSDGHFLVHVFDYLADKGIIYKISQTIRITPKSKPSVEEIAYQYIP